MTETETMLPWGGLSIDADGNVYLNALKLDLAPKEQAVLHRLLIRWPNVVRKDEFSQHIWAGRMMSDESLARCVARARKALSAVPGVWIRALYGQGYCIQRLGGPDMPVPAYQAPFHQRLMDIARAPSQLAETVAHCETLIHLRSRFSMQQSERLLRAVLQQDGNYPAARVLLATCLAAQVNLGLADDRPNIAEGIALLAPAIARGLPGTGLLTAHAHLLDCSWRFAEAEALHGQALQQAGEDATTHYNHGWHLLARGQREQALAALQTAHTLRPFSVAISIMYARALLMLGLQERALEIVAEMCARFPDSAAAQLYWISLQAGRAPSAEVAGRARQVRADCLAWPLCNSNLSYIHARCGDHEEAWRAIRAQDDQGPTLRLSHVAALFLMDAAGEAFDRIEQAFAARVSILPVLLRLPEVHGFVLADARGRAVLGQLAEA
ncbi:tetratricopeptide repeat protein [Comamonas endophytica]|uniref:Winged helix-turn-helix domain-containing protein n=1 Tax=Comamonas endophytica TaxID=2949090 RepID=A0ABY6G5G9_9BURK|nr:MULTISPECIES: tetratricopeptide repeat protein [unclassified Acidovorax]MCD2512399.1 winged helix-turn-helix domain-containing protein [Acidovorax sp. D4N7]UYG50153.1 winged helix-turn-helix domain-containing protein [Acidovorax sp. 5MLIR]